MYIISVSFDILATDTVRGDVFVLPSCVDWYLIWCVCVLMNFVNVGVQIMFCILPCLINVFRRSRFGLLDRSGSTPSKTLCV